METTVPPKAEVFGVGLSLVDYDAAGRAIIAAARARRSFAMTALATHGLVEAARDPVLAAAINRFDLVTPDGQPVRWALNLLREAGLSDRVAGPDLLWRVCAAASAARIGVFVYGSTPAICARMVSRLRVRLPDLEIAGIQPDRFREAAPEEDEADVRRINASGAGIVLVGRGCPRQEFWVAAHRGRIHAAMLAVGAAFDFAAAAVPRAPLWMQRRGLEWLHRLAHDPRRLFARYARTNGLFMLMLGQALVRRTLAATSAGPQTRADARREGGAR